MSTERTYSGPGRDEERVLDSWKEISSYLGRAVRTAQTWEKEEGLPVHRHQHARGSTVFAYPSEIDAWKAGRDEASVSIHRQMGSKYVAAIVLALIAVSAITWLALRPSPEIDLAPDADSVSWVLIGDLENRTGDPLLVGTLETAIAQRVVNSFGIHVVPRERVVDTLHLMRREPSTPLEAPLAREVALRDGGIRAVIEGRIKELDGIYGLEIEVVDPASGTAAASFHTEVSERSELLSAAYELAAGIPDVLGRSFPRNVGKQPLESVSTDSLLALQLYSRAESLMREENLGAAPNNDAAEALLQQAIAEDPEFASAHLMLGWAVIRRGRSGEEGLTHMDRALTLVHRASEIEAFFIRGSRAMLAGDHETAAAEYLALIAHEPGHFWAANNLPWLLRALGRRQDSLAVIRTRALVRPKSFALNYLYALNLTEIEGFASAEPQIRHALSLIKPEDATAQGLGFAYSWLRGALTWEPWLRGDLRPMLDEIDRLNEEISNSPAGDRRQDLIGLVLSMERGLGRLDRTEFWTALVKNDTQRQRGELLDLYYREELEELVAKLQDFSETAPQMDFVPPIVLELLALTGQPDRAVQLFDDNIHPHPELVAGHIALARADLATGIEALEEGLTLIFGRNSRYFLAIQVLAEAYRARGDDGKARVLLEEASLQRSQTISSFSGSYWIRHQVVLADFYRDTGLVELAKEVESEALALLAYADEDHPLRLKLLRRVDTDL